jgi:hypothetical protein
MLEFYDSVLLNRDWMTQVFTAEMYARRTAQSDGIKLDSCRIIFKLSVVLYEYFRPAAAESGVGNRLDSASPQFPTAPKG